MGPEDLGWMGWCQGAADGGEFGIGLNDSEGSQVVAQGWKN